MPDTMKPIDSQSLPESNTPPYDFQGDGKDSKSPTPPLNKCNTPKPTAYKEKPTAQIEKSKISNQERPSPTAQLEKRSNSPEEPAMVHKKGPIPETIDTEPDRVLTLEGGVSKKGGVIQNPKSEVVEDEGLTSANSQDGSKGGQEAALAGMRRACEGDLKYLCQVILGMKEWGVLHTDIAKFLRNSGRKKMILVPRGHLKSSVVTIGYTIQSLLQNPDTRILIANAVWDNARKFLSKIQDYLTEKSVLPTLYGNFQSRRWNQDEIVIRQRKLAHAEPTVATTGVEKTQTSQHYDKIIMDDLVVRENINTREQMDKVINFYRDTLDLLEPGGELIIVGTRWAMGDLYQYIMENEMVSCNGHKFKSLEERRDWRGLVAA